MRNKILQFALFISALLVGSCKDVEKEVLPAELSISPMVTDIALDGAGGEYTVEVNSNEAWFVDEPSQDWCDVKIIDDKSFKIIAEANPDVAARAEATLRVVAGQGASEVSITLKINQEGKDLALTTDIKTESYYKGDYNENNTGSYWINFISTDLVWSDDEYSYIGPGFIACIDFNSTLAENADLAMPASGTYAITDEDDCSEFTVNAYESYITNYDEQGNETSYELVSGTMTISQEDSYQLIECEFVLDNGETFTMRYKNTLKFYNRTQEGQHSNLEGDVKIDDLTQGFHIYCGEAFTSSSDLYMIVLAGDDFDLNENYGAANSFSLMLNTKPNSAEGIPSGEYSVITLSTADDLPENTYLAGEYAPEYGGYIGSVYYNVGLGIEATIKAGTVTVVNNGDYNYDFTINCEDGFGNKIEATYSGELFYDEDI